MAEMFVYMKYQSIVTLLSVFQCLIIRSPAAIVHLFDNASTFWKTLNNKEGTFAILTWQ
jgi:hypothetical protein